ncbi:MAG: hypothetical protein ACOY71_06235 [Gemmatimonadota bacterium]
MVMLSTHRSEQAFDVYDDRGHKLGRITRPLSDRLVGLREGTVYLERDIPGKAERQDGGQ